MRDQLNTVEQALDRSSRLVQQWGNSRPPGRPTVRDLLQIDGISVWDVMAVELALYQIPSALSRRTGAYSLREILLPFARPIKYAFRRRKSPNVSACEKWPSGPVALFLGFSWYMTRDVLVPIATELKKSRALSPVMLSIEPDASNAWSRQELHLLSEHFSPSVLEYSGKLFKDICRAADTLINDPAYEHLFRQEVGTSSKPLRDAFKTAFVFRAAHQLSDVWATALHILTKHRPSAVISTDVADPRTRIFTLIANAQKIPVIQIQFGQAARESVEWRFFRDDILAVEGKHAQQVMVSHGVPPEKIRLAGSPRYDGLGPASPEEKEVIRKRFGIQKNQCIVVLASAYFFDFGGSKKTEELAVTGQLLARMKRAIFSAVDAVEDIALIVKPHPLESVSQTREFAEQCRRIHFADNGEKISPLIAACDVFMSFGSATTMEALVIGKPIICPVFPGWLFSELFTRSGAIEVPKSEGEILAVMQEIATDSGNGMRRRFESARRAYLEEMVCQDSRSAVQCLASIIDSAMRQNPTPTGQY